MEKMQPLTTFLSTEENITIIIPQTATLPFTIHRASVTFMIQVNLISLILDHTQDYLALGARP